MRKKVSPAKKQEILKALTNKEKTALELARENNISVAAIYQWKSKFKRKAIAQPVVKYGYGLPTETKKPVEDLALRKELDMWKGIACELLAYINPKQ